MQPTSRAHVAVGSRGECHGSPHIPDVSGAFHDPLTSVLRPLGHDDRSSTESPRHIALVAHDNKKVDLLQWAEFNLDSLARAPPVRDRHHREPCSSMSSGSR